jgi:hypothetical protein
MPFARALGFTLEQADIRLAARVDVRGMLAKAGDTFRSASRIVFGRVRRTGLCRRGWKASALLFDRRCEPPGGRGKDRRLHQKVTRGAIPEIFGGPGREVVLGCAQSPALQEPVEVPFPADRARCLCEAADFGTDIMEAMIRDRLKGELRLDWRAEDLLVRNPLPM